MDSGENQSHFITCQCQHCGGGIEFDASRGGESTECPHCKAGTVLFSRSQKPPIIRARTSKTGMVVFWSFFAFILVLLCGLVSVWKLTPEIWEKSDSIQNGNAKVSLRILGWGSVLLENGEGLGYTPTADNYFKIQVTISNLSSNQIVHYKTWRSTGIFDSGSGTLSDNFGNFYQRISFNQPISGYQNEHVIYPSQSANDLIIFEYPVHDIKWLHLRLPAQNFGGSGDLRFEIPENP